MSRWSAEEIRELVTLWPTSTAAQIAYRLHRPRAAICGKAKRLLEEGLLEGKNAKNPNPRKRRRRARPLRNLDHAAATTATSQRQPRDAAVLAARAR